MKFGMISLDEAEGATLAHSVTTPSGALKKGRVLAAEDIARLREGGLTEVMAARFEAGDVAEDEAARRIAEAAAGDGADVAAAFTGRANLMAKSSGLALVDGDLLLELNRMHEGLTIATLAPFEKMVAGQLVATIKVITFALPEETVAQAETLLRARGPLIAIAPFATCTAGLILTRVAGTSEKLIEKRKRVVEERLEALGSRLGRVEICDHDLASVTKAIEALDGEQADPLLIFGGTAIVDRGDVIPAAVTGAGGEVVHLGMPVDPGNLLLIAKLGGRDVIGLPSCAGSPKINGFDWVLERRLAGLDVGWDEVAAMGLGGLLKETQARIQPRRERAAQTRRAPRIAVVVLAAGRSTRMGARNKLLEELQGEPIVQHVTKQALASKATRVLAVTGHQADMVRDALEGLDVAYVDNPDYGEGLSTSLRAGVRALDETIDGAIICLGDMPQVEADHLDKLIAAFAPKESRSICVPIRHGRRGNPVLWGSDFFEAMAQIRGDAGAKHLIGEHEDQVAEVDMNSDAIFVDVDTPETLWRLRELALHD
jgi:molybdenum cofactor cytidylyltransferase